jgi:hypothetical protein
VGANVATIGLVMGTYTWDRMNTQTAVLCIIAARTIPVLALRVAPTLKAVSPDVENMFRFCAAVPMVLLAVYNLFVLQGMWMGWATSSARGC